MVGITVTACEKKRNDGKQNRKTFTCQGQIPGTGIIDAELIECFVLHIPVPPPVSSISVNITPILPVVWAKGLEVMPAFLKTSLFNSGDFQKASRMHSFSFISPNSNHCQSLTRAAVALTVLTSVLAAS